MGNDGNTVSIDAATDSAASAAGGVLESGTPSALRWILGGLLATTTAAFATYNGVAQILIPAQVQQIDPAAKVANLALLASSSTVTALIGLFVGGALSDRTYGRWGATRALAGSLRGSRRDLPCHPGHPHQPPRRRSLLFAAVVCSQYLPGSVDPDTGRSDPRKQAGRSVLGCGPGGAAWNSDWRQFRCARLSRDGLYPDCCVSPRDHGAPGDLCAGE